MIAKLINTYSPSSNEDIYSNFMGLLNHSQGPMDTLDFFTSTIDPHILRMVFVNGLLDQYSSLQHDFCLHASCWSAYSLEALQQEVCQYSLKVKNSVAAPPRPSSVTAKPVSAGGGAPALPTSPAPPKVYSQPEVYKLVSSKTCICGRPHPIDTCGFLLRAGIYLEINEVKATDKLKSLNISATRPPVPASASHASSNCFAALESDSNNEAFDHETGKRDAPSYTTAIRRNSQCKSKPLSALYT